MAYERGPHCMDAFHEDGSNMFQTTTHWDVLEETLDHHLWPLLSTSAVDFPADSVPDMQDGASARRMDNTLRVVLLPYSPMSLDQSKSPTKVRTDVEAGASPSYQMEVPSTSEDGEEDEEENAKEKNDEEEEDKEDVDDKNEEEEEVEIAVLSSENVPTTCETNAAANCDVHGGLESPAATGPQQPPAQQQGDGAQPPPPQNKSASNRRSMRVAVHADCFQSEDVPVASLPSIIHSLAVQRKRKMNNGLERRYRFFLAHRLSRLRALVPGLVNAGPVNNIVVLKGATEYIELLKEERDCLNNEKTRLLSRRQMLLQKLHYLKG